MDNVQTPVKKIDIRSILKHPFFIPLVVVLAVVALIVVITLRTLSNSSSFASTGDGKVQLAKPKATQVINKEFLFPLTDSKGKEVSKIKYFIEGAEIRDELIVKGKRARAVEERTFLILRLKVTNDFNQGIKINARDYIRLSVNGSKERLAADIHNDPVEIQAISTKYTRLGFPINESDKNLVIYVGEINGNKQTITLTLK